MPAFGEVPEWTIGAVSKTVVALGATEGSNPSLSALFYLQILFPPEQFKKGRPQYVGDSFFNLQG